MKKALELFPLAQVSHPPQAPIQEPTAQDSKSSDRRTVPHDGIGRDSPSQVTWIWIVPETRSTISTGVSSPGLTTTVSDPLACSTSPLSKADTTTSHSPLRRFSTVPAAASESAEIP